MGQPVLLLHGMATNAERTWRETGWIDLLGDFGAEVIAPDLLGHGSAPQPTDPAAYDEFEQYVLDRMGDEPVDAVGFSLGARTLLAIAIEHPERFNRIAVAGVGANLFRQDGSSAALAAAIESDSDEPMVHHFRQLAASCGQSLDALTALLRRPNPPAVTEKLLADMRVPTLVVLGDQDFAGPADPLVDALPNVTFVPLRGVDHFSTPKQMGFIDATLKFFDL
ncbi:MAG: alpha/beta fold hydrolase [Actinobacteria bacterium]|nr:alpha/beta fold hydrolase [Actinomycetota bacterium]